jgi:hypothetical protein
MALLPTDKLRVDGKLYVAPCWPPPERVVVDGRPYTLARFSQLTDEEAEAALLDFVSRGAEYEPVETAEP